MISLGQSWLLGSFPLASLLTSVPLQSSIAGAFHPLPWLQSSSLSSMWLDVAPLAAVLSPASTAAGPPALGSSQISSGFVLSQASGLVPKKLVDKVRSGQFIEMHEF